MWFKVIFTRKSL